MPLLSSTLNFSSGIATNLGIAILVSIMSVNASQVMSKGVTRMYNGTGSFVEVVKHQLGGSVTNVFNFCVLMQRITLPLVFIMVSIYELNHLWHQLSTEGQALDTLMSLAIIAIPGCILSLVTYGSAVMYAGMLNVFSFAIMAILLVFLAITKLIPSIRLVTLADGNLYVTVM